MSMVPWNPIKRYKEIKRIVITYYGVDPSPWSLALQTVKSYFRR